MPVGLRTLGGGYHPNASYGGAAEKPHAPLVLVNVVAMVSVGGWWWRCGVVSDVVDLIDREKGSIFGVRQKSHQRRGAFLGEHCRYTLFLLLKLCEGNSVGNGYSRNGQKPVGKISTNSTNTFSAAGPSNTVVSPTLGKSSYVDLSQYPDDPNMPDLKDITYSHDEEDVSADADFSNLETTITVSHIPTTRVHKDHHVTQIIGDLSSATQTRSMTRMVKDQGRLTQINNEDFYTCMFVCFLSQEEPKRVHQALKDPSWIEAMLEELLQFKMQKNDESGIVIRNKARLVAQGHTREEGIDYEEVFAPVARIETVRLFLAYASFMGFMVYQMNVKSAFLYGTIEEEVYVCQPPGFKDPDYPELHQAPRAYEKSASTPIDTEKPLIKDLDGEDVDVHTYSDYDGASLDRKSTTGGCQFLCCRLISWQCKKKAVVATSSTEAEYVAAASSCAQVLWIQNQLLDYGLLRVV
nr:hypothetical protein [Tanacetum cinerariifolium]